MKYFVGIVFMFIGWFGFWLAPTDQAVNYLWFIIIGIICFLFNGTWEGEDDTDQYWGW